MLLSEALQVSKFPIVRFKDGELITKQGNPINHVFYLESGTYKRTAIASDGTLIVLDFQSADGSPRCMIGALSCFRKSGLYESSFEAVGNCICRKIARNDFKSILRDNPQLMEEFLGSVIARYDALKLNFEFRQSGNTPARLCQVILESRICEGPRCFWNQKLSFNELGRYLGVHRVIVSKMVSALQREGVVVRDSNRIEILDIAKLTQ